MPEVIKRKPRTAEERRDWQTYLRIARDEKLAAHNNQELPPAKLTQLNRARTRLLASGVLRIIDQNTLRQFARDQYKTLPWWKKLRLRFGYWWKRIRTAHELKKIAKG